MIVEGKEEKGIYKCPVHDHQQRQVVCVHRTAQDHPRPPEMGTCWLLSHPRCRGRLRCLLPRTEAPRSGYLLAALSSSMSRASPMPSSPDRSLQMRAKPPKSENTTDSQTLYIYHNFN